MRFASNSSRRGSPSVRLVARIAVLTALSVLVRRFLTPQVVGLNLGGFPIILSGLVLGPVGGAYVGILSDILGAYLMPHGPYNVFYTFTAMLTGMVPALVLQLRRATRRHMSRDHVPSFLALLGAILAGQMLTKVLLIPLYHEFLTNVPWWVEAVRNGGVQLIHAPLYAALARGVLRALPPHVVDPAPPRAHVPMPSPGLALPLRTPYS